GGSGRTAAPPRWRRRLPAPARSRWGAQIGYPPSRRSARGPARWCRRNGGRHRQFRSRSIAGLEERARSAAEDWLGSAAAEDWPERAADWLGPIVVRFPSRA